MFTPVVRLALIGALLLPAACGGDDEGAVSASDFARTVCTSLGEWLETLQSETEALQSTTADLEGDLDGAKASIEAYIDDVVAATDDLLEEVDNAGHPDVEDGEEVAEELRKGLQQAKTEFEEAGEAIAEVDTDDPEEFVAEFERIGGRLQDGSALEEAFSGLERFDDNEELDRAFDEEEACQTVSG